MTMSSTAIEEVTLPSPVRIGWVGAGVMSAPLCEHLLHAGYALTIHSRTKAKADGLLQQGAQWVDATADIIAEADVVFTFVSKCSPWSSVCGSHNIGTRLGA
jgi:3-hydroxyisobutyrate dehydrogenase